VLQQLNPTVSPSLGQCPPYRAAPNVPATVGEAGDIYSRWPHLRASNWPGMTVGDAVDPPPKPLPESFFRQFAASVAASPERYGRLIRHALKAAEGRAK
jgi:hypothetical protein